jgi:glycosyltransferase involved in cell wall biosynthesis
MTAPQEVAPQQTADAPIRVLMITAGWPQPGQPQTTHFVKRQVEFLQRAGVQVDVFQFRGAKRPWNYVKAWNAVRPMIRSGRYDLVHAQFGQSGALALPWRLPLVVTFRGSDILGIVGEDGRYTNAGRVSQLVARLVAKRADAVVVVGPRRLTRTRAPVLVLPSGLDFELFRCVPRDEARRRLGWPLDKRLVLFAGNPDQPRKRYPLAKAAVDVLNRTLSAELVVAWACRITTSRSTECLRRVRFTSMQEGSPNVVKEALACDLPVVSVAIGDAERLNGIDGWCVRRRAPGDHRRGFGAGVAPRAARPAASRSHTRRGSHHGAADRAVPVRASTPPHGRSNRYGSGHGRRPDSGTVTRCLPQPAACHRHRPVP